MMRKNLIYYFFTILFILLIISFNCTLNGVELGLVGTWELTDYEADNDYYYEDVEGMFVLYSNDTYDIDFTYTFVGGGEMEIIDYGTCKACHVNKLIQFFSDKDDDYDKNCKYTLNWKTLTVVDDQRDITMTYQKVN